MQSIIYGLSNEEYHHGAQYRDYLSSSQLKWYLRSPKHYKHMLGQPPERTNSMRFGSLFHDCMAALTDGATICEVLDAIAVFDPPVNERTGQPYGATTKAYNESYERFIASNKCFFTASATEKEAVSQMTNSLLHGCGSTSEQVLQLLKWGKSEVSHFVEIDGLKYKFRPDLETKKKIIDYKTVATDDLSERSINNIIIQYGYDISAAYYLFLEHEQSGVWKTFYWIFVSKQPPYDAVLVDASEWTYRYDPELDIVLPQVGAIKMRRLLDLHIKCSKESRWPGAEINIPTDDFGRRIMRPTPPPWEINLASDIIEQTF